SEKSAGRRKSRRRSRLLTRRRRRVILNAIHTRHRRLPETRMSAPAHDFGLWLSAARDGSRDALGRALEACRRYLLCVAHQQLNRDLQAKGGASDLVQETFLEAQSSFDRFHGSSEVELRAWLRQLLHH